MDVLLFTTIITAIVKSHFDAYANIPPIPTEYNGLPVVRRAKELGRNKLSSKTIINHPSGHKLGKFRNGYIILCRNEGCGGVGSKDDVRCQKHGQSYVYCRYPNCKKKCNLGYEHKKALVCADHKLDDMWNVTHVLCKGEGCKKLPYFGVDGGYPEYCSEHKTDNMRDVVHTRCKHTGCNRIPSFGTETNRPLYCNEHKLPGMKNVKSGRCQHPECDRFPSFAMKDEFAQYCKEHRLVGMINVATKKCISSGCKTVPSFSLKGERPLYCKQHKTDEMVNTKDKRCEFPECMITPCYGFVGGKRKYCNTHKEPGMINITYEKCNFSGCATRKRFGFPSSEVEYCSDHKQEGMVNLRDKKCVHDDCEHRPSQSLLFTKGKIHCKYHSNLNEYTYGKHNPVCHELQCRNPATCVAVDDTSFSPIRCLDHKLSDDVELIKRQCSNCEESHYYPENRDLCMNCGQYREIQIQSLKEQSVEYLLQSANIPYSHNKRVCQQGSRHRPDFLIAAGFGYIVIEVDENQHKHIPVVKEETRMKRIYADIQYLAKGKQVLFLRYNPDNFYGEYTFDSKARLEHLLKVISVLRLNNNLGTPLGYVKLYYDGFNGHSEIQPLDTK